MAELKPGNEVSPAMPVDKSFRPPNSLPHEVSTGEDWHSLAKRYHIDVKKLIWDNFQTGNPKEINWYLHNYICCDLPTADRYNWRFSTTSRNARGSSHPRAGIVFVVLNWQAILQAAKKATRDWVLEWFGKAKLHNGRIEGTALILHRGSVVSPAGEAGAAVFEKSLKDGGATDQLAKAWAGFLKKALGDCTAVIEGSHSGAFPSLDNLPSNFAAGVVPAEPLNLLRGAAMSFFTPTFFLALPSLAGVDSPAARNAIHEYSAWFATSFRDMAFNATTQNIVGGGAMHPGAKMFIGAAAGDLIFTNLHFRL